MLRFTTLLLLAFLAFPACRQADPASPPPVQAPALRPPEPDWFKNANIYEVNIRQYTPEGTFAAFEAHLPRLRDLGVDVLWLMPIHPISEAKRKGSLGSPYANADYTAVNPGYGTMEDFKRLVSKAHELGMKLILDWVPNHTGWDHVWIAQHPDWYTRDPGTDSIIHPAGTDWTDVADLNYGSREMRKAMGDAMLFWLREADIDGFRCDVSGFVPDDFWAELRPRLDSVKTVFMLSENGDNAAHFASCFNANYGWPLKDVMLGILNGAGADTLSDYMAGIARDFPSHACHMSFITNHDENTWNKLPMRFGAGEDAYAVLAFTLDGMPLIYSGQESGLQKQLSFFDKDQIDWGTFAKTDLYRTLLDLKHRNEALWNGIHGGRAVTIPQTEPDAVFAYYREQRGDRVVAAVNLSGQPRKITLQGSGYSGTYRECFRQTEQQLAPGTVLELEPWGYRVYASEQP